MQNRDCANLVNVEGSASSLPSRATRTLANVRVDQDGTLGSVTRPKRAGVVIAVAAAMAIAMAQGCAALVGGAAGAGAGYIAGHEAADDD